MSLSKSQIISAKRQASAPRKRVTVSAPMLSIPKLGSNGGCCSIGYGTWSDYTHLDSLLGNRGYRVRYLNGLIEIMSISFPHENTSDIYSRLVAEYCDYLGMDYQAWGSTTQKEEGTAAAEPDQSFSFGAEKPEKPDLYIEVAITSGGIDKLKLWEALGATEIWVWQKDKLHGYVRKRKSTFKPITESKHLPGLKLSMIEEAARIQPTSKAVRAFRAKLAALKK